MTGRTYPHLEGLGRPPSEYELVSTQLLYYPRRGFAVATPVAAWYARHQRGSPLAADDWDGFADPRQTTYRGYVALQQAQEAALDQLVQRAETDGHDARLGPAWLDAVERLVPVLRFPVHGLQMVAAYVGQMAPGGRLVIASLFQAADELRRVQRLAYRTRQLQDVRAGFGAASKAAWQDDPMWQPWRRVLERLLVTYDWGEALCALGLVVKPAFDELFGARLAQVAERRGDPLLAAMLGALAADARWHQAWTAAAVDFARAAGPDHGAANARAIDGWVARWRPPVAEAVAALEPWFEEGMG